MTLDELLCMNSETMPMGYAKALIPRVDGLLKNELPNDIKRQLYAIKKAMESDIPYCVGLDRLHYFLDRWENNSNGTP